MAPRTTTKRTVSDDAAAVSENTTARAAASVKEFDAEDLIKCKSITQGELLLTGKRSGILYRWFSVGDVIDVEYQDLLALNASRSKYLYGPYFVIENEELLEQNRWKPLKEIYAKLYEAQDMDDILDLPPAQLKRALAKFPASYQQTLAIEVTTRIENGSFDSINRIKVFDEVLGTDLMCLIN